MRVCEHACRQACTRRLHTVPRPARVPQESQRRTVAVREVSVHERVWRSKLTVGFGTCNCACMRNCACNWCSGGHRLFTASQPPVFTATGNGYDPVSRNTSPSRQSQLASRLQSPPRTFTGERARLRRGNEPATQRLERTAHCQAPQCKAGPSVGRNKSLERYHATCPGDRGSQS